MEPVKNKTEFLPTIKHHDFFDEKDIKEITDEYWKFKKLFSEHFLEVPDENVHINEFQPNGFWHKSHDILRRKTSFEWDLVHLEYEDLTNDPQGVLKDTKQPGGTKEFVDFLHRIKGHFNTKEFFYYVQDKMNKGLSKHCSDFGRVFYYAFYNLNYVFETHTDGRDVKCKRDKRKENFPHYLKPDDWLQEQHCNFTRQGLVNLDVANPTDGTVTFKQTFPYSVNIDMGVELGQMKYLRNVKQTIQFVKGDEPHRFMADITDFTHKIMDEDEYDQIMEHCFDENVFPIESTYGLSLDKILTLDTPGTFYSWDCQRFHKVKPYPDTIDPKRRRLTIHFTCAEEWT